MKMSKTCTKKFEINWLLLSYFQGEGDDCSLTDTIPEDTVSCSGAEIQTPNTLRKGKEK